MASFSARQNDSRLLASPDAPREAAPLDDSPTVISSDPLNVETSSGEASEQPSSAKARATSDSTPPEAPLTDSHRSEAALSDSTRSAPSELAAVPNQQTVISKRPPISDLRFDQPHSAMELGRALVGKRLAHFELEEFLGGGMGAVFRGRDLTLGRSVAVKVLPRGQDEDTIRRFKNEAQSAARLNHENIARVYYIGEENGWSFIIFEHIEGVNIRALVDQRGPLSLAAAINHTLQAAEALDHAYRRDVVHRDIKPSNLIVSNDGGTKLVDMGLARLHQVEASQNDLTASGVTLGTFDYISPEQARDPRTADVRSDIYSLGCTLYFMLTGRPPFPDGTVLQKLLDHQSRQPPDVRVFRPDLPDAAAAVVNRMLSKAPEERYQTPGELIAELLLLADRLGLEATGPRGVIVSAPAPAPPSWIQQHISWIAPTLLLITAVLLTDALLREGGAPDEPAFPPIVASSETSHTDSAPAAAANGPTDRTTDQPASEITRPADAEPPAPAGPGEAVASDSPTVGSESASPQLATGERRSSASEPSASQRAAPSSRAGIETLPAPQSEQPLLSDRIARSPSPGSAASRAPSDRIPPTADAASLRTASSESGGPNAAGPETDIASPASPPPDEVTLVVAGSKENLPAGAAWVEKAADALRQLNKWPNLKAIELRFDGPQKVPPVTLARREFTLRAAPGFSPVLVFESASSSDRHMIAVKGGKLNLEGVQLQWSVPEGRVPLDWAMILLDDAERLSLERCVLTIENVGADGQTQYNGAAFVRLASSTITSRAMQDMPPPEPPEISLSECIVRGEADLVVSERAETFDLIWKQGLLTTTGRLAEIEGMLLPNSPRTVSVTLDHVTAAVHEGLCRIAAKTGGNADGSQAPMSLLVQASHCVFATDPAAPLIEHETQNQVARLQQESAWPRLLSWSGSNNVRVQGDLAWRIEDEVEMKSREFRPPDPDWTQLIAPDKPFSDADAQWINQFVWKPHVHEHTADSYLVRAPRGSEEPSADSPGFSRSALPKIHDPATTP